MTEVVIVVSVDWEGRSLLPENRDAIRRFRRDFPNVPLQHFLNPAYYTPAPADAGQINDFVADILAKEDECGLHIHAWRSLVEASGVTFRSEPTFIDAREEVPRATDDWGFYPSEGGYDVPLNAYDTEDLLKIIATARDILRDQGFDLSPSFRAGGWMSAPNVQAALANLGFRFDCSPVDPQFAIRRFGDMPLCRWLAALWHDIGATSQPRMTPTPEGDIWLVPDNGSLIDYTPVPDFIDVLTRNIARARAEGGNAVVVTGFHQETARLFLDRLAEALRGAEAVAKHHSVPIRFAARMSEVIGVRDGDEELRCLR